jgi:putative PEP-CTERM system TPR-repeat lipoprotein
LAQGDYFNAEDELEKAESLGSNNVMLIADLVQVKTKLNKFDYVYEVAEQSRSYPDEQQVIILTYAGISAIQENKFEQAKAYIEKAIGISEDSVYGAIGKAYISHSGNQYKNGLETVDELLESNPNFAEAILLKGYLLQGSKEFESAATTFSQYLKLRPKDIQVRFFIAQNYVFATNYEAAEPYVDELLKIAASHPLANQLKAEIAYSRKDYTLAKDHAVISFQGNDNFIISKMIAGISAYKLGDFEQSYQYLISLKDVLPPQHMVRKLIIDLQLKLGYDLEAASELQYLIDLDAVDSNMLIGASNNMLASGNIEAAQALLQSSIALKDSTPIELAQQGVTQLRLNQTKEGIARLEQALKLDPELVFAEQSLAIGYVGDKQYDKALEIAKQWQESTDKRIQGYLLESLILDKQAKVVKAQKLLEKALELDQNNVAALYKLAIYAHRDNNIELAFDYYTQILKLVPQHLRARSNFIRLIAFTLNKSNDLSKRAANFYKLQLSLKPDDNNIKLGLAFIYSLTNNNDAAILLFKEIKNSKDSLTGIEIVLGDTYKKQGKWKAAEIEYQNFVDVNPNNLAGAHKLFSLFEQTNQLDKALTQINKTLVEHQNNAGLLLLKSFYLSKLNRSPNQSDLIKIKANETTANHWLFDQTLGNFAYNQKDFSASSEFYAKAYAKNPTDTNVINWSKSIHLTANKGEELTILKKHISNLDDKKIGTPVMVMLAGAYMNNDELINAKKTYKKVLETEPENIFALNNLSYIELEENNVQQSLSYAKQAIKLLPNNVAIIDTYAQALVANKQYILAIEQFDKAIVLDRSIVKFSIDKAEALKFSNQSNKAKSLLMSIKTDKRDEQARISQLLNGL